MEGLAHQVLKVDHLSGPICVNVELSHPVSVLFQDLEVHMVIANMVRTKS